LCFSPKFFFVRGVSADRTGHAGTPDKKPRAALFQGATTSPSLWEAFRAKNRCSFQLKALFFTTVRTQCVAIFWRDVPTVLSALRDLLSRST
jgi:hypothetical protein